MTVLEADFYLWKGRVTGGVYSYAWYRLQLGRSLTPLWSPLDLRDRLQMEPEAEVIADNSGVADFRVCEKPRLKRANPGANLGMRERS